MNEPLKLFLNNIGLSINHETNLLNCLYVICCIPITFIPLNFYKGSTIEINT